MTTLTKSQKEEIVQKFGQNTEDTGSSETQIALFSQRIQDLTGHLKKHPKDFHSRYGMIKLISQRRKELNYLKRQHPDRYQKVIQSLELRG